jgi:hypothetical protein
MILGAIFGPQSEYPGLLCTFVQLSRTLVCRRKMWLEDFRSTSPRFLVFVPSAKTDCPRLNFVFARGMSTTPLVRMSV